MNKVVFSVIVPVYNGEKYLAQCLQSIRRQTFRGFELIIVDDGSTDSSAAIARHFGKLILSAKRGGAGAARNLGAKNAQGEYLAFTDSDCLVPKDWLEKFQQHFQEPKVIAIGGGYSQTKCPQFIAKFNFYELLDRRRHIPKYTGSAVANNLAIRRSIFQKVGGFPEGFKSASAEDLVLTFLAQKNGQIIWDKENGVGHYFNAKLLKYLRQQLTFAKDGVISVLYYPEILKAKTHFGGPLYLQPVYFVVLIAGLIFWRPLALIGAAITVLSNYAFFQLIWRQEGLFFTTLSFFLLILRNFAWLLGGFLGIIKKKTYENQS